MSRQPAEPVVRPLIIVKSEDELASLLDSQPVVGDTRRLCAALNGYAVILELTDSVMSAFVMVCDGGSAGFHVVVTNSVEVVTSLVGLPCSIDAINQDTIEGALQGLVRYVANQGGWTFGDFNIYERESYSDLSLTCKLKR